MNADTTQVKILLVDDSPMDRVRAVGLLSKANPEWKVDSVSSGEAAIDHVKRERPDVLVTDLVMPGMDGRSILKWMSDNYPLVPVVLITSQGNDQIAAECVSLGAVNYVPKTLLHERLPKVVAEILSAEDEARLTRSVLRYIIRNRCQFEIPSDVEKIRALVNFVRQRLHGIEQFLPNKITSVTSAVREALLNAHFHGNMQANARPLQQPRSEYIKVASERRQQSPYSERKIMFTMCVEPTQLRFQIADEGPGFDYSVCRDVAGLPNERFPNGNGIRLIKTVMESVRWNDRGNEITLVYNIDAADA